METENMGSYTYSLKADSGYEMEQTGRISPDDHGAVIAVLDNPDILKIVKEAIKNMHKGSNV